MEHVKNALIISNFNLTEQNKTLYKAFEHHSSLYL